MNRFPALPLTLALALPFLIATGCDGEEEVQPPTMNHASFLSADVEREDPGASDAELAELVSDHTSFAVWMYHRGIEANGESENMLFSPLSISTAFSMVWPGALGDTADEIAAMLHFGMAPDAFHPAGNLLDRELASRNEYEPGEDEGDAPVLHIVNDLWGLKDYPYVDAFLELLARHYGAGMWIVDFIGAPEEAREEINAHIAYETRGLIEELLPENSITSWTRLVLTNAIYFKGAWQAPFDEADTADAPFTALDGTMSDVSMMTGRIVGASHAEVDGAEVVELGYVGGDLSMVLILPDEGTFLDFEAGLDQDELSEIMGALSPVSSGSLAMPRFEFDTELDLVEIFEDAGYEIPFDGDVADFRGLSEIALIEELHIGGAFHKAAIAVDEEGTVAAAATAIVIDGRTSEPVDEFDVRLDRPFVFVIRDRPTGTLLFMGRVVDAT